MSRQFWISRYKECEDPLRAVCGPRKGPSIDHERIEELTSVTLDKINELRQYGPVKWKRCGKLLDFGCGPGRLALGLALMCEIYHGVDIVPKAIAQATESYPLHNFSLLGEECYLPFLGPFNVIVCVTVLQHVVDKVLLHRILSEFHRVTCPGSVLVMCENTSSVYEAHAEQIRFRSIAHYTELLAMYGWRVLGTENLDKAFEYREEETHTFFKAIRC